VDERVAEVSRSISLVSEAIRLSPQNADALVAVLDRQEGEELPWRRIVLGDLQSGTLSTLFSRPESYGADADFISHHIENSSMQLGAWVNTGQIHQQVRDTWRSFEMAVLLVVFLSLLMTILLQRWLLLKPIAVLIHASERLVEGDPEYPLSDVTQRSSLGPLFSAFIRMRRSLTEQRQQLESQIQERKVAEERLNESHEISRLGCWEWLLQENRFWCSDSLKDILLSKVDYPVDLEGFISGVHPADRSNVYKKLLKMKEEGEALNIDFRVSLTSGGFRHVYLISHTVRGSDGSILRILGTCQDITDRKNIEASLKKLSSAITHSGSSVIITDVIGAIEYANPKFVEITGYSLEEVQGQQPELLSRKWISADRYDVLWQSLLSGQNWRGELQSRRKDGTTFWSLVSISPINNEYGELTHFVIVCEDVTELKDAHARMERLALYDELTGLPNRRLFFSELALLFEPDVLESPAVVMLLDLDYFKTINDTQGHQAGDQLLIEVARRLVETLHDDDIAARLGGDEFAILIHPVLEVCHVETIAKRILSEIARPFYINDHEIQISTSLGVAWLPADGQSPEALLKHADLAMYQAKEMGRNQFRFFTESLHDKLQAYVRFSREMPKALEADCFKLLYQPQVDLKSGKILSVEALVRWEHPELGLISPQEFIPIAEETGFIVPLGRWILATACRALKHLSDNNMSHIKVAINLSSRQFRDPELLNMIRQTLAEQGIAPNRLELEITESLLMQDIELAIATLKELQALGMTIAIDDFGIGYSSFNYLKKLPINVLKVDREFIKDIPDHLDDMEITAAIISMAHRLGMIVVAEGIETPVQQVFLEEHHCDIGQGYLFSRPISLDSLVVLLAKPNAS
jgi:diguanylate cyclase (GGDEF)-like protein/PAS domain S-box-containing protein